MIYTFDGNNVKVSPDDEWEEPKPQKAPEKKSTKFFSKKSKNQNTENVNTNVNDSDLYEPIDTSKNENSFANKSANDYNYYQNTDTPSTDDSASSQSMDELAAQALAEVQNKSSNTAQNNYYEDSNNTSYDVSDAPDPQYQESFLNAVNEIPTAPSNTENQSQAYANDYQAGANDYSNASNYSAETDASNYQDYSNASNYQPAPATDDYSAQSQTSGDYSAQGQAPEDYSSENSESADYSAQNNASDYYADETASEEQPQAQNDYFAESSQNQNFYAESTEETDEENEADTRANQGADITYINTDASQESQFEDEPADIANSENNASFAYSDDDASQLLTQIDAFRKNAIELSGLMSKKQNEVKQLEEEVSRKEEQNKKLSQSLQKAQKQSSVISAQLDSHMSELKSSISESVGSMKTEFLKSKEETDKSLIDQINKSTSGLSGLKNDIGQSIHNENVEQYRNIQQLINENNSSAEVIETLKKELKGVHSKLTIALLFSGLNFGGVIALILHSLGIF